MKANLLKAAMAETGVTQGQLAKAIGISENSMSRKVLGKREFTVAEAEKISVVLNIKRPQDIFLPSASQKCNER